MTKSAFLAALKPVVISAASDELGPMWSAVGCPYIETTFSKYSSRDAKTIESVIRRFAPAARNVQVRCRNARADHRSGSRWRSNLACTRESNGNNMAITDTQNYDEREAPRRWA